MIVYISDKNRVTDLLFNTQQFITTNNLDDINKDVISALIKSSFGEDSSYEIQIDNTIKGQYIIIETETIKKYIMFSYEQPDGTRNGYILTKTPVPFRAFLLDDTIKNKCFEVCLIEVNEKVYKLHNKDRKWSGYYSIDDLHLEKFDSLGTINPYNIFAYKLLKTCDIKILNEKALPFDIGKKKNKNRIKEYTKAEIAVKKPFENVNELKTYRLNLGSKNTGNKSSYIIEADDYIVIYGKTFGNNGFEVVMLACGLAELARKEHKKIFLYQIKDNLGVNDEENKDAKPITTENLELLRKMGIIVYDELQDYENNPEALLPEEKDSRNQMEFMKNLMKKWGEVGREDVKKCYLCGCTIQKTIIASHIQRVCDINKLNIPFSEKRKKAVDGNNGFWLCANHDKMFEFGIISFDETTGEFVLGQDYLESETLTQEQIEFIREITKKDKIDKEHFTKELQEYLKIHNERIKNENKN